MEHMSKMSESEQKEYISKVMSEMGTTPEEVQKEVEKELENETKESENVIEELKDSESIIEEVKD